MMMMMVQNAQVGYGRNTIVHFQIFLYCSYLLLGTALLNLLESQSNTRCTIHNVLYVDAASVSE